MLLVDTMLENTSTEDEKVERFCTPCFRWLCRPVKLTYLRMRVLWRCQVLRSPTRYTLGSMVSHFQKLFDVTTLSGVYPRMTEVYARLGEMTNTMRNLRDVLQLGNLFRVELDTFFGWFWTFCGSADCLWFRVRRQGFSCRGGRPCGRTGVLH